MGFITDALGITGDSGGPENRYTATAPENNFRAYAPDVQAKRTPNSWTDINTRAYADAVTKAQQAGMGTLGQQGALAQQYADLAAGKGTSLAQEQLAQSTAQNRAAAAGAIASQRGLSPALATRILSGNQANLTQQAAGQAAQLRSQEQLAALQGQGTTLAQQAGTAGGLYGTAGNILQGAQAQNLQAALANQRSTLEAEALNQQTQAQNANLNLGAQQINAGVAAQNANTNTGIAGGIISGLAGVGAAVAGGGMAAGGEVDIPQVAIPDYTREFGGAGNGGTGIGSGLAAFAKALMKRSGPSGLGAMATGASGIGGGMDVVAPALAGAPGAAGLACGGGVDFRGGGHVPGEPTVEGDSAANDVVPAMLSPGEVVERRSVTSQPGVKDALLDLNDHPEKARAFVEAIKGAKGSGGYGAVLEKRRELARRRA